MSLWKGKRAEDPGLDLHQIETLLKSRSLSIQVRGGPSAVGKSLFRPEQIRRSDSGVLKARELNSDLADVRYRLGQAYVHTGQKDKAQAEFTIYQKSREQHLAELERQTSRNSPVCLFCEKWRAASSTKASSNGVRTFHQCSGRSEVRSARSWRGSLPVIAATSCEPPPDCRSSAALFWAPC